MQSEALRYSCINMKHLMVLGLILLANHNGGDCAQSDSSEDDTAGCDIKMRIYDPCSATRFLEFCIKDALQLFHSEYYNKDTCNTVLLTIPFLNNVSHINVQLIVEALTSRCMFNIIVLDNSNHTDASTVVDYPITMEQIYNDSMQYAAVINDATNQNLLQAKCLTAIGFSLGAQMVGHVCRNLGQKCTLLYAIDPAAPLYFPESTGWPAELPYTQIVSKSDADRVFFLRCNGGVFGTPYMLGHVNIIVNGGTSQPNCTGSDLLCSHEFCNRLLADAIRNPGECQARKCKSYYKFRQGKCNSKAIVHIDLPSYNRNGSWVNTTQNNFYLKSDSNAHCLGSEGTTWTDD